MDEVRTTDLTLTRSIPAAAHEVFDAWLDTNNPGGLWFGVAKLIINPVPNGLFYHAVEAQGREWAHYGRFIVIERPKRIQHTWVSPATRGLESIVTLGFEAQGAGTLVTLHHAGIPDDPMGLQHRDGWGFCLQGLHDRFARR